MKNLSKQIILGSQSPRRGEIVRFFSIPFIQLASDFDESSILFQGSPTNYVKTLAKKKGSLLAKDHPDSMIITADTVVYLDGKIYNKPKDQEEALCFLEELSGRWHTVYTALALSYDKKQLAKVEKTDILFHTLDKHQIGHYLQHVNFLDKAGGYAIQQSGSLVVKKIKGCYYNVMGLPICALQELLQRVDINLWEHMNIL